MGKSIFRTILVAASLLFMTGHVTQAADSKDKDVILSTTTSTQDSGLLNELIPLFEKQSGYRVKTVAVGTGQALAMAAKGEADVVLVHAPSLENKYVAKGHTPAGCGPGTFSHTALQSGSRADLARRVVNKQHGLSSRLRIPSSRAFWQRNAWADLRRNRQADRARPDR